MPDSATLCNCMNVSCGAVRRAFQSGCVTVESLAGATGASTLCGSCKPLLAELSGAPVPASPQVSRGARGLAGAAIVAALLCIAIAVLPHVTYAASVQGFPYDTIWRNGALKQTTGFTLLGLSLAGMALSVRKRWRVAATRKWGDFGYWRMAHAMIGAMGLVILLAHTGMRFGAHLNFALMSLFTAANLFGAIAGGAASLEQRLSTASGMKLRRWITWTHVLFVWPLPVLIGFHILSVYYF
jgi:nitrite reductase (NADH) large subunit